MLLGEGQRGEPSGNGGEDALRACRELAGSLLCALLPSTHPLRDVLKGCGEKREPSGKTGDEQVPFADPFFLQFPVISGIW